MTTYDLNLVEYIPEDSFGPMSPNAPAPLREREKMGFGDALIQDTPAYRIGGMIAEKFITDDTPDPNYDPFQAWKDAGADDSVLSDYMDTVNGEQLFHLTRRLNESRARRESIEAAGFTGQAANFLMNVAADPTTYFGFGSAMMLKGGMGALKAGAISGGLAGAAMSAQQEFYAPEEMTLEKGAAITAATTVMGGLLGKAVDSFANLKSKGLIQKDFDQMSTNALTDAVDVAQRAEVVPQSVGAAVAPDALYNATYSVSTGGNVVARSLAKAMSVTELSPKMFIQSMESRSGAIVAARMFGSNVLTKSNMEGVAGKEIINVIDETRDLRKALVSEIQSGLTDKDIVKTFGRKREDKDNEFIARALYGEQGAVEKLTPLQRKFYDWAKKYYKKIEEMATKFNVPFFNSRSDFGQSVIFVKEKVAERIGEFKQKVFENLKRNREDALKRVDDLKKQISELELRIKEFPDPRDNAWMRAAIERKQAFADELLSLSKASDDDLLEDASVSANKIAAGIYYDDLLLPVEGTSKKSRFFNERLLDPLEWMDFIEHDPIKVARKYTDSVSPHIAFSKAFPEYKDVSEMANDVKEKVLAELADNPDKASKEAERAVNLITRAWNTETGIEIAQKMRDVGGWAPWVTVLDKGMYISQMGGQVLAALLEPVAVTLHHGLGGGKYYGKVVSEMMKDPLIREASKKEAGYLSVGLEVTENHLLQSAVASEISEREIGNQAAKMMHKGSLMFAKMNLSVFWDSIVRQALAIAQTGIIKERLLKFNKLSKEEIADLAFLGIDKNNIKQINEQLKLHGEDIRGVFYAHPEKWTDENARDAWVRAIRKDNRRISVQSDTGDTPFLFRTPFGRLFTKYKTWPVTATQKYLIQATQKPMKSMAGIGVMVSTAAMYDYLLNYSQGKDVSTDPDELLLAGINRSGILGILPEAGGSFLLNRLAGIQSGGGKFYEYQDFTDAALGALGNFGQDIANVGGAVLPKYDEENGYTFGFTNEDGDLKKAPITSLIDILPIPVVKPWVRSGVEEMIE